jgi:hypothetical protein
MTNTAQMEMPKYSCHKQVWALKIKSVEPTISGGAQLAIEDEGFAPVLVTRDWAIKHQPKDGGYYVVYKDGYKSFSPAKAFEDGYTKD